MPPAQIAILLAVGLGVGVASGIFGLGGGVILVPVLYTWLGWPLIAAVAGSHFCGMSVSMSATSRYAAAGLIDFRRGIIMEVVAVLGASTGAWIAEWVPGDVVAVSFAVAAILSAVRMWQTSGREKTGDAPAVGATRMTLAMASMFAVGIASGILGIGGGVLIVPILTEFLHMPIRNAVATSGFMVGLNAATAGIVYFQKGNVIPLPTAILAAGMFLGATTGPWVQARISAKSLRRAFAVLLIALALRMVWKALVSS